MPNDISQFVLETNVVNMLSHGLEFEHNSFKFSYIIYFTPLMTSNEA